MMACLSLVVGWAGDRRKVGDVEKFEQNNTIWFVTVGLEDFQDLHDRPR